MKYVFLVFWIMVIILGITFSSLNAYVVKVNYYTNESAIYLPVLLIITLGIGALLGVISMLPVLIRNKQSSWRLKQRLKHIEQEVNNLHTLPVKEEI